MGKEGLLCTDVSNLHFLLCSPYLNALKILHIITSKTVEIEALQYNWHEFNYDITSQLPLESSKTSQGQVLR